MNNYFPHDSNARNNEKLIALRMKYGWEGYGIYWAIIEKLRDAEAYRLSTDFSLISFDLQVEIPIIESIIHDFKLFTIEADSFHSESLCQRMILKDTKSEKAREAAKARWNNDGTAQNKNRPAHKKVNKSDQGKGKYFTPPTFEQVESYCTERGNNVNPRRFIDFYEAKGWMIGHSKMKSWQAAVRTWERDVNKKEAKEVKNEQQDGIVRLHPALQQQG